MKGLKIIPLFIGLILFSYLGVVFVEANRTEVVISFGNYQSTPTAVGFVVLTSVLLGMVIAGALASVEILALFLKISKIRRRLSLFEEGKLKPRALTATTPPEGKSKPEEGHTSELG